MISFEASTDADQIRAILTAPEVYRRMGTDDAPRPEDLPIPINDRTRYLLAKDGAETLGLFMIIDRIPTLCEVHFCMTRRAWGAPAREICAAFLPWLWRNTRYDYAVGNAIGSNRLAIALAKKFGFVEVFRAPQRCMKNGTLQDEVWLGIRRPLEEQHATI